ncbi:MAG: hypothetical protein F4X11_22480 [Acidobacteria bacterium]|nr:hypothetical protein [Acidobacteriota bacterium]
MRLTPSRFSAVAAGIALAAATLVPLPAVTSRMPVDEIEVGMRGFGVTVFGGATRDRFDVQVLGVLTNVLGPRRSLIVARLEGGPLAQTGVIQGMSGSPVYIDDRLVGAVSYALGSFSREAIAGITPIEEMAATDSTPLLAARRWSIPLPPARDVTRDTLVDVVARALPPAEPFARRPGDVRAAGLPAVAAGRLGALLRPIATPLVLSGFTPEIHDLWNAAFGAGGLVPTVGGQRGGPSSGVDDGPPLQPGDPIGASLIQGDLAMAGTGTVTLVEDGRVYAFGHPFYNLGRAQLPMTRAHVTTLLPSLAISSRLATIGPVLGTIDQDRSTGIYGSLGNGPELIPVTLSISAADRRLRERFTFEIIDDPLFTPILTLTGVLNTFLSWNRDVAPSSTYEVSGIAALGGGYGNLAFGNVFTGQSAAFSAALSATTPLMSLLGNRFGPVEVERIDIDINTYERPRTATLEQVRIDADRIRPGDTVPIGVVVRTVEGVAIAHTVDVELPRDVTGSVQLLVADAATLDRREVRAGRQPQQARSLPQLIRALSTGRQQDRLYVQLLASRPGAVVRGQPRAGLPPSVLAVLDGDRAGGDVTRLREATLGEWEVPIGYVTSGSRQLSFAVEAE